MTVLGIDPGLGFTGYGLIKKSGSRYFHIEHGVIETTKNQEQGERLFTIYDGLCNLIKLHKPALAGVESLYFAKNVSSGLLVSQALGVILLALKQYEVEVCELAPNTIKKSVTGVAKADKNQVQQCVKIFLGLPEIPKPDHAADALAIAITAGNTSDTKLKIKI